MRSLSHRQAHNQRNSVMCVVINQCTLRMHLRRDIGNMLFEMSKINKQMISRTCLVWSFESIDFDFADENHRYGFFMFFSRPNVSHLSVSRWPLLAWRYIFYIRWTFHFIIISSRGSKLITRIGFHYWMFSSTKFVENLPDVYLPTRAVERKLFGIVTWTDAENFLMDEKDKICIVSDCKVFLKD